MSNLAVKIPIIESEAGWGRKIDDWMVCLTNEDAKCFEEEFNSKNTSANAPGWYMQVEGNPEDIYLNDDQYEFLKTHNRVYLSTLKKLN